MGKPLVSRVASTTTLAWLEHVGFVASGVRGLAAGEQKAEREHAHAAGTELGRIAALIAGRASSSCRRGAALTPIKARRPRRAEDHGGTPRSSRPHDPG
jgi:hypothetical protein